MNEQASTPSVLLVDDTPSNLLALEAVLAPLGARLVQVSSGKEAIARVTAEPFAVALLDVQMPGMDGFETAAKIRATANGRELPILFVTAIHGDREFAKRGYAAGAADYVTKPFDVDVLRARVRAFVDLFRQREQVRHAEVALRTQERDEATHRLVAFERIAEERLRRVLLATPALICSVRGPGHVYEFANPAYALLFGDRPLVGEEFASLGTRLELLPVLDRALQTGEQVTIDELRTTGDGDEDDPHFVAVRVQPERGPEGGVESLLLFLIDTTAHVQARRALEMHERERATLLEREREARVEAEAANRTKDEFLATVSHELRTPLNAILGWSRLARSSAAPDTERALAIIERNATVQARIIEDVLDVSRIISGKLRLDPRPMRLEQPIQGALEAVRPAAEAKQIELVLRVGALPEIIGDPDRIQQVVWNLLSNAVKFTPKGGHVALDAELGGDEVALRVTDSGQGIDARFLPHVFDAFRQADSSTTRRHGGLGLGLAIVKQLVYAHGGTLRADSEGLGRGATFTVSFPTHDEVHDAPPAAVADVLQLATRQPRLDDVKVLVVDDEEDARMLLVEILTKQGAATVTAASAKEALVELDRFHPDVVVSDIGMPEADGYMLLERIRTLQPGAGGRTPAVALTAYARPEDAARALQAGFQTHLAKPVDASRLISAVARLSGAARPVHPPG